MYSFITIIIVLLGILLGAVVLIQNPKGGGLSGSFGGVGQQLLGARRSTDVIEKLTWGFAGGLLFLCLMTSLFIGKGTTTIKTEKSIIEQEQTKSGNGFQQPTAPAAPAPGASNTVPADQAPAGNPQ